MTDHLESNSEYINCEPSRYSERCFLNDAYSHPRNSFENFQIYRNTKKFCDITIKVGPSHFPAHKIILASASEYFYAMFNSSMREANANVIELFDVDPKFVEILLNYIYMLEIEIDEENVQGLLLASNLLQICYVKNACCKFLEKRTSPSNALGILTFADTHNCQNLIKKVENYILENFLKVSITEEFYSLTFDRIKFLISNNNLAVDDEEEVYIALISWIKFDMQNRQRFVNELFSFIKLPLIRREFLTTIIASEEIVKSSEFCKDLLIEAMKYQLFPEMRRYMQTSRTAYRLFCSSKFTLYVIGGQNLCGVVCECELYHSQSQTWLSTPSMLNPRTKFGIGVVSNKLYAIGGSDGFQDLSSIEVFNNRTKVWSSIANCSMAVSRSCLGVAVLHNLIYAIGGFDGLSCLNSVERFDPSTQQWTSVSKMNAKRQYASVEVIKEHIIVAGGYDGKHYLSSCEMYDPVTNCWSIKSPMHTQRGSAAGCVLNGNFYISGGSNGFSILSSVEQYNVLSDIWTLIQPMINIRSTHVLAVMDNKIYALGGTDGITSLNSVEVYILENDEWINIVPMGTRRSYFAAALLLTKSV